MKYTKIHLLASALAAFVVGLSPAAQAQTKPLLIGQTYVQTGPLASLSPEPVMGVRAMLNALNANGGINGRPVELRQLDDAYDPAKGAENVKTFVKEGAVGIPFVAKAADAGPAALAHRTGIGGRTTTPSSDASEAAGGGTGVIATGADP